MLTQVIDEPRVQATNQGVPFYHGLVVRADAVVV